MKGLILSMLNFLFPGTARYWERRYAQGGTSGSGSAGKLANYKAEVINNIIANNFINSVIDFGCGDGYQASLLQVSAYIGLDISLSAVELCRERFKDDKTKRFSLYVSTPMKTNMIHRAEMSLSLDVLFHIIEPDEFECYLLYLFTSATRFVVIYAPNYNNKQQYHQKTREFTKVITNKYPEWELVNTIFNIYPAESNSNFYIYKRRSDDEGTEK